MADEGDEATISVKFTSSDKRAGQVSISLESTIGAFKNAIRCEWNDTTVLSARHNSDGDKPHVGAALSRVCHAWKR